MSEPTAQPIRKGLLPCIPPPEWEFSTVFGARTGTDGCALFPGDTGPVVVRRRVTYGDWEPVRPDHWAPEPPPDALSAPRSAVQAADGPAEPRHAHDAAQAAQGGPEDCWLCLGKGALAIHNTATEQFGRPLWTAHKPTSRSHPVQPCPACGSEQPPRTTPDNPAASSASGDRCPIHDFTWHPSEDCTGCPIHTGDVPPVTCSCTPVALRLRGQLDARDAALAAQLRRNPLRLDQARATVARIQALADEHPVAVPTNLLEEALDQTQEQP